MHSFAGCLHLRLRAFTALPFVFLAVMWPHSPCFCSCSVAWFCCVVCVRRQHFGEGSYGFVPRPAPSDVSAGARSANAIQRQDATKARSAESAAVQHPAAQQEGEAVGWSRRIASRRSEASCGQVKPWLLSLPPLPPLPLSLSPIVPLTRTALLVLACVSPWPYCCSLSICSCFGWLFLCSSLRRWCARWHCARWCAYSQNTLCRFVEPCAVAVARRTQSSVRERRCSAAAEGARGSGKRAEPHSVPPLTA